MFAIFYIKFDSYKYCAKLSISIFEIWCKIGALTIIISTGFNVLFHLTSLKCKTYTY